MAVTRAVLGPVSAYQEAVAGGYTGTEAEFRVYIATVAQNAQAANQSKIDAAQSKTDAESAATRAETAAEEAASHNYGISISGTTLTIAEPTA